MIGIILLLRLVCLLLRVVIIFLRYIGNLTIKKGLHKRSSFFVTRNSVSFSAVYTSTSNLTEYLKTCCKTLL